MLGIQFFYCSISYNMRRVKILLLVDDVRYTKGLYGIDEEHNEIQIMSNELYEVLDKQFEVAIKTPNCILKCSCDGVIKRNMINDIWDIGIVMSNKKHDNDFYEELRKHTGKVIRIGLNGKKRESEDVLFYRDSMTLERKGTLRISDGWSNVIEYIRDNVVLEFDESSGVDNGIITIEEIAKSKYNPRKKKRIFL